MALVRINLTNGTTTLDLYTGAIKLREGGLNIGVPPLQNQYITNPYTDGDQLTISRYANRTITLQLKCTGASLADLKTNIRQLERMLTDAIIYQRNLHKQGLLTASGKCYLELQWADVAAQSTYFEVVSGKLDMPPNWYSAAMLLKNFTVLAATLTLECQPYGFYTAQDIATATTNNNYMPASTSVNYQDITVTEAYGDVSAPLYIKIVPSGATATTKLWIAKRSGFRQTDTLWTEAENETSFTGIYGGFATLVGSDQAEAACSNGNYFRVRGTTGGIPVAIPADTQISRINYDIATPPRGAFRVLARCKVIQPVAAGSTLTNAMMFFGYGYSYGSFTKAPSNALGEYYVCAVDSTWEVLDLGLLIIPPTSESDIASNATFQLRIFQYVDSAGGIVGAAGTADWMVDYIFLLPIDEGYVMVNSSSTDVLAIDGITNPDAVYKLNTSSQITDCPSYLGAPFTLGRESTRIYFLRNDFPSTKLAVDTKYQARFRII